MLLWPGDDDLPSVGSGGSDGPGWARIEIPVRVTTPAHQCTIRGPLDSPSLQGPHLVQRGLGMGVLHVKLCDPRDLFGD